MKKDLPGETDHLLEQSVGAGDARARCDTGNRNCGERRAAHDRKKVDTVPLLPPVKGDNYALTGKRRLGRVLLVHADRHQVVLDGVGNRRGAAVG